MSCGEHFLNLLSQIGYQSAGTLHPSDFDWIFDNPLTSEFVESICANVNNENVLTANELEEYDALLKSDQPILEGVALEGSVKNVMALETFNDDIYEDDELYKEDLEILEKQLKQIENHCKIAFSERNRLRSLYLCKGRGVLHERRKETEDSIKSSRLTTLNQRKVKLSNLKGNCEKKLTEEQINALNLQSKLDDTLKDVSKNMKELQNLFTDNKLCPLFLSSLSFEKLYYLENMFMDLTTEYIQKQFLQNVDSTGENSDFQLLSLTEPGVLLLKGCDSKKHAAIQNEINRLQTIYPKYEAQRLLIQAEVEKKTAVKAFMLQHMTNFNEFCSKVPPLQTIESLKHGLQKIQQEYLQLSNHDLQETLKKCVQAEKNLLLTGNYNEKLIRQQYFISKQDTVISMLLKQKSFRVFLTMLLELENQNHIAAKDTLSQIQSNVDNEFGSLNKRIKELQKLETTVKDGTNPVSSAQKSLFRLQEMLSSVNSDSLSSSSSEEILTLCKDFWNKFDEVHTATEAACQKQIQKTFMFEQNGKLCEKTISSKSIKSTNVLASVVGIPDEIVKEMVPLNKGLDQLEHKLSALKQEYATKEQELKLRPDLKEERSLFIKFCNDPETFTKKIQSKILMVEGHSQFS